MKKRTYLCIDLKSFYASVECIERGLDPMTTNLVVADASRTQKTICLAVSPSLKRHGIPGRARLFEVIERVKLVNAMRLQNLKGHKFEGESYDSLELDAHPEKEITYITAPPRMAHYIEHSTRNYNIYLKYVSPDDIHVYSIDEVFMDITNYLPTSGLTPYEFAQMVVRDVLKTTGITAAAGIGTNMYLAKIAMDIVAKHIAPDEYGVRIAELDEMSYRRQLWDHKPLTDFWRVGRGYAKKLEAHGLYTMGDIARCSVGKATDFHNEDLLYKLFGVNAELLIDHAWGWEPCTIADVKAYKPEDKSIGSGQVLHCPYESDKARLVVKEMTDLLALDLVDKSLVTDQLVLTVGYDIDNLAGERAKKYKGEITIDHYGRKIPKHAHGTANLPRQTSSSKLMTDAIMELYDRIVNPTLLVRRLNISVNHVVSEDKARKNEIPMQFNLFDDVINQQKQREKEDVELEKEKRRQQAILEIKKKFGKNAILKGMNFEEAGTTKDRNEQIGGHRA